MAMTREQKDRAQALHAELMATSRKLDTLWEEVWDANEPERARLNEPTDADFAALERMVGRVDDAIREGVHFT